MPSKPQFEGKTLGNITLIRKIPNTHNNRNKSRVSIYYGKCKCGNEKNFYLTSLIRSLKKGIKPCCGCTIIIKSKVDQAINNFLYHYKFNATDRGLEFKLDKEYFTKLIQSNCEYCGITPSRLVQVHKTAPIFYFNGIDRIDNTKGYLPDNVRTCCKYCNIAKYNQTEEDFIEMIKRIYNFYILKNK